MPSKDRSSTGTHYNGLRRRMDRNGKLWKEFKESIGCQICGETFAPCLHWHHLDPSTKMFNIAHRARNSGLSKTMLMELQKCTLVCGNCHQKIQSGLIESPPAMSNLAFP
jgi:hypothetical protein